MSLLLSTTVWPCRADISFAPLAYGILTGLDVMLQRKSRNPVAGMLLVSDAADSTRRAQMDLVLARAEAAYAPIHSFGYGRSHDPASLWLMSNHHRQLPQ